jgi:hypothetical protein
LAHGARERYARVMASRSARMLTIVGVVAAAGVAYGLALAPDADAKASFDSPYTLEQTYNAALRLVRVDMGLKITERDPAAAYVLFDYKTPENGQRPVPGSIEMVPTGHAVKVVVQLSQMPRYHEQVLADSFEKKLRDEYGDPPPPRDPSSPDGGDDAAPE